MQDNLPEGAIVINHVSICEYLDRDGKVRRTAYFGDENDNVEDWAEILKLLSVARYIAEREMMIEDLDLLN